MCALVREWGFAWESFLRESGLGGEARSLVERGLGIRLGKQRCLNRRAVTTKQNVGRRSLGDDPERSKLPQFLKTAQAPGRDDSGCAAGSDPRDPAHFLGGSPVQIHRCLGQRKVGVGSLRIAIKGKSALGVERELLQVEAVVAQQIGRLEVAKLATR